MIISIVMIIYLAAGAIIDIRKRSVTTAYLVFGGLLSVAAFVLRLLSGMSLILMVLEMLPGLVILLIARLTNQKIGYGDGWLILFCGPVFGLNLIALGSFLSFFLAGAFSASLVILKKAGRNTRLPFIPFLAAGMGVMYAAQFIG